MRFLDYFKSGEKPTISFEIFPPKTDQGMDKLLDSIPELIALRPDYITVTYGAMGTTRKMTLEIASLIRNRYGMETACHLTCAGSSRDDLDDILGRILDSGIRNIVALRGDPPKGEASFVPHVNGYSYGSELVNHIRRFERQRIDMPLGVAVAGYPEKHIEAPSQEIDIANLKLKVQAGGDLIITQLFLDNAYFFDFVKRARSAGIAAPIVPGLMPIMSVKQIKRITAMCGSKIPPILEEELDKAGEDDEKATEIGVKQCIRQAQELLLRGAPGIHFYVLNKSSQMQRIMKDLKR